MTLSELIALRNSLYQTILTLSSRHQQSASAFGRSVTDKDLPALRRELDALDVRIARMSGDWKTAVGRFKEPS